jgi:cyclohexadieny/prephenate dehydrogenase
MPQRIAILGLGLIGSSLARALAEKQPGIHIAAFDVSHEALAYAAKEGFIHSQHAHAGQAANEADIIVFASPPSAFASLAADIAPFLKAGTIVTDTGSVKRHSLRVVMPHVPDSATYVPGHPIAGSEQTGVQAGSKDLFSGKRVILTPEENAVMSEPVSRVRRLWETVGARVEYMPADLHDRIYAYVSHLSQLVAFACQHPMQGLPAPDSEPYRRSARLTKSNRCLWADICLVNADYVDQALGDFADFASQMEGELSAAPAEDADDARHAAGLFSQVVATCLIATASLLQELTGVHPARYAGSGFADMTAPATADPEAALQAISSHHQVIAAMLREMLTSIHAMQKALKTGDKEELIRAMRG